MNELDLLQNKIRNWVERCFGRDHAMDSKIRALRLVEEAIEFAQAVGAEPAKLHALIDYVYTREAGDPAKELGGVGNTWLAAAASLGVWASDTLRTEVDRVLAKTPEHFAARNQVKVDAGFK